MNMHESQNEAVSAKSKEHALLDNMGMWTFGLYENGQFKL